ncbi:hypothetical protein ACFLR4_04840, partial [Bacteroidota bacterium]
MKKMILSSAVFFLIISFPHNFTSNIIAQDNGPGIIRAMHAGGNWGENRQRGFAEQPADYYKFLRDLSINWAGITVGLHVDNSLDDTVERDYSESLVVPTLTDEALRNVIQGFKTNNMSVMLSLAIEGQEAGESEYPFQRWQLGDPFAHNNDPNIETENWPWNPGHANHAAFVQSFWETYAQQAAHFAKIAEGEEVEIFAIGAETDRLFRTRISGMFPNEFKDYIQAVVDSVKKYFTGYVTYEQHWSSIVDTGQFGESVDYIWEDVGLDIIGISAYFQLADETPNRVYTTAELETVWTGIFNDHLIPLQNRHTDLPIYFLEFGYVDVLESLFDAAFDSFEPYIFQDADENSLDDGREQQANAYESFFNVNETNNYLINGTFLWGFQVASDENWNADFGQKRTFNVRDKLAEDVVIAAYTALTPLPGIPVLVSPPDGAEGIEIENIILDWDAGTEAASYNLRLSETDEFSNLLIDAVDIVETEFYIAQPLIVGTDYWWRLQSVNAAGTSEWTAPFSFSTQPPLSADDERIPDEYSLFQNYPNPFNPSTTISYQIPELSFVELTIFDMLGNEISKLVEEEKSAGSHNVIFYAGDLSSG